MSEAINLSPLDNTDEDKKLSNLSPEKPVETSTQETSQEEKTPVAASAQMAQLGLSDDVTQRQEDVKVIQEEVAADNKVKETIEQSEGPEDSESFMSSLATVLTQTAPSAVMRIAPVRDVTGAVIGTQQITRSLKMVNL